MTHRHFLLIAALLAWTPPVRAQDGFLAAAETFANAIATNDSLAAASILADDARILEGGRIETREEYLAHHFHSDAAYVGALDREELSREVKTADRVAWVMSTTRMTGTFRDRAVDSISAELLVLRRTEAGWKVAAVHWSSRRAPE